MINQPTLAQILIALRQQKNWTQEELTSRCHVSVRTIQRIESGTVTPRKSTINLLLAALDYNPANQQLPSSGTLPSQRVTPIGKGTFKSLQGAWIAGILYLLCSMTQFLLRISTLSNFPIPPMGWVAIATLKAILFFLFIRGFLIFSRLFEIRLLRRACYLYAATITLQAIGESVFLLGFHNEWMHLVCHFGMDILIGCAGIAFGFALLRLQDAMGRMAQITGIFEILASVCLATTQYGLISTSLMLCTLILEVIILYRATKPFEQIP